MFCFGVSRASEFYKCFVLAFPEPRFSVSANGVSRSGVRNHATALAVVRTAPRLCPMNRPDTVYFTRSLPPTARCRQAFVGCRSELADRRNRPAWQRRGSGQSPISRTARRHWWLTRSGLFPPQEGTQSFDSYPKVGNARKDLGRNFYLTNIKAMPL